ncbi:MAG: hypothetical protein NTX91_02915 [candidate division SR1 bacterium]|nr:hypothetical protein [candidate division SR1 bacterium]
MKKIKGSNDNVDILKEKLGEFLHTYDEIINSGDGVGGAKWQSQITARNQATRAGVIDIMKTAKNPEVKTKLETVFGAEGNNVTARNILAAIGTISGGMANVFNDQSTPTTEQKDTTKSIPALVQKKPKKTMPAADFTAELAPLTELLGISTEKAATVKDYRHGLKNVKQQVVRNEININTAEELLSTIENNSAYSRRQNTIVKTIRKTLDDIEEQGLSNNIIKPRIYKGRQPSPIVARETPEMIQKKIKDKQDKIEGYIAEGDFSALTLAKKNCESLKNMNEINARILDRIDEKSQEIDKKYAMLVDQFSKFKQPDKKEIQEVIGEAPVRIQPNNIDQRTGRIIDDFA